MKLFSLFNNCVDLVLTERLDGNMKVTQEMSKASVASTRENRRKAVGSIGLNTCNTALIRVTYRHSDFCKFRVLDTAGSYSIEEDLSAGYSDGMLTCMPNLGFFLPLADCLGLVLYDTEHHALMIVHCGRHTLLQNGAAKAVSFMTEQIGTNPGQLQTWFSPCAGKVNYPLYEADNKGLQEYTIEQLINAGVSIMFIEPCLLDTTTTPTLFSHSRGDTSDRFAICARLCASPRDCGW